MKEVTIGKRHIAVNWEATARGYELMDGTESIGVVFQLGLNLLLPCWIWILQSEYTAKGAINCGEDDAGGFKTPTAAKRAAITRLMASTEEL